MYKIICAKIGNDYLMIGRNNYKALKISKKLYDTIVEIIESNNGLPEILFNFIYKNFGVKCDIDARKLIIFREAEKGFHAASYEIIERCNFKCRHCYLDEKRSAESDLEKKLSIIRYINNIGCLWLQITGGEPLLSNDFEKVYLLSYSLGMLLTVSTNGSLILKYGELFKEYPPYRLAVSLYGATVRTYEKVTGVSGYFPVILNCFDYLKASGLRVRVNIIVLKDNCNEVNDMERLARKYGLEYHIYNKISPGLSGSDKPLSCAAEYVDLFPTRRKKECYAGKKFFHIDSTGKASICKIARSPNFDIFTNNQDKLLNNLRINSESLLEKPGICIGCNNSRCQTCPPLLELYRKAGHIPPHICQKGGDFNGRSAKFRDITRRSRRNEFRGV